MTKKLRKEEIEYLVNIDVESHWSNLSACNPNLAEMEFKHIADEIVMKSNGKIKHSDIFIYWHAPVAEYCLNIKGKWSGYVYEFQILGYKDHEEYYGGNGTPPKKQEI